MEHLLYVISTVCGKIKTVSDLFWDFPTNFEWYSNIPILGNFSLAIILLVGSGIYFTIRLRFVQVRKFKRGIEVLKNSKAKTGISPLASFFLSTAMRVGPGNMSNEAGQGTITMAAAASDAKHPSDQGCVQTVGVFLDTMVISTLTGFGCTMGTIGFCKYFDCALQHSASIYWI